ncbi:INO80 complex subunit Ies4-domain-containing protein [Rhypophila decipiens]|uniref:INO80 complex subunit Ies4-domain-containing protein n=1 Tax=Rhypophila decipiens TaxID=261697 RepID=A0AAN7BFB7_9PEZI|nr:INO80 complex subunit Ies4-domain-containing protein [Rhypophila decipiens]
MAPSSKNASASKDRRKSGKDVAAPVPSSPSKQSKVVVLKVKPKLLRAIVDPDYVKEDTPPPKEESTPPVAPTLPNSSAENASDSTPNTPGAGTPAPQPATMGPPAEGPKKKGPKRTAAALGANGEPKVRGKPGPKKKQRLEDGSIEPSSRGNGLSAHKLGPKANQGAINAGLRALDRSGKPCRKWTRGGFTMKSFTGVVWEIPRWTAPPKVRPEASTGSEADNSNPVSTGGDSSKENSTNHLLVPNGTNGVKPINGVNGDVVMNGTGASSQAKSEGASNTNEPVDADVTMVDVDLTTASAGPASVAAADSNAPTPAPVPIAAA